MATHWIDTREGLETAVAHLLSHTTLALDLEGVALSRHGEVSVLQAATGRHGDVYIFDITTLGPEGFEGALSLRTLLECPTITKLFWDLRSDLNALHFIYKVLPTNVLDLQVMECAHRILTGKGGGKVSGLKFILDKTDHAGLSEEERASVKANKESAHTMFNPDHGGSYALWKVRPLNPTLLSYCTDGKFFFSILDTFQEVCSGLAMEAVARATQRRVDLAQREEFDQVKANKDLAVEIDKQLKKDVYRLVPPGVGGGSGSGGGGGGGGGGGYRGRGWGQHR